MSLVNCTVKSRGTKEWGYGRKGNDEWRRFKQGIFEQSFSMPEQWGRRGFRIGPAAEQEIKIEVPQMGDSITEGSVASLEHKAG
jgi:hypothetical protein